MLSGLKVTTRKTRTKGERWVRISTTYGAIFEGIVSEREAQKVAAAFRAAAEQLEK
jgi:hypothetical protein